MKAIVCGSRHCEDEAFVFAELDRIDAIERIELVIEGGQRRHHARRGWVGGVDLHAYRWSWHNSRAHMRFDADWDRHGQAAGPLRNKRMIAEGRPTACIVFPGGVGTANMEMQARRAGIRIIKIEARGETDGRG